MIFRFLLLINIISSLSGTFVVNVTQTLYQTEENNNVTLEWTFTTRPHTSYDYMNVLCNLFTDHGDSVLLRVHEGVEVSESQDEQFSGRVQFDRDVLREGRVRVNLSRLRTDDSGLYMCEVKTNDGWSSDRCRLNVTALKDSSGSERKTELNNTGNEVWRSLYWAMTSLVILGVFSGFLVSCLRTKDSSSGSSEDLSKHLIP